MKENKTTDDAFLKKRAARQRKLRKRRIIVFLIFIIVLAIITGAVLCLTVFFKIENYNISGSSIYTEAQIKKASGLNEKTNLFAVRKESTENKIRQKLPLIDSIEFERELPATLNIKVKDAVAKRDYYYDGKYYKVSQLGYIMKIGDDTSEDISDKEILILGAKVKGKCSEKIAFGDASQKELIEEIENTVKQNGIKLNSVDITDSVNITLRVEGKYEVLLGTANYLDGKIKHLSAMLTNITEQSGRINLNMWTDEKSQGTFIPGN